MFGRGFDQPLVPPPQQEEGGSGSGWPPSGLELVVVGSKFSGDAAEPSSEGGPEAFGDGSGSGRSRGGGGGSHEGFYISRRVSRLKRRGSKK